MRTFLVVPYQEKDLVKKLGAKWSPGNRLWYVEDVEDMEPFLRWVPDHLKRQSIPPAKNNPLSGSGGR